MIDESVDLRSVAEEWLKSGASGRGLALHLASGHDRLLLSQEVRSLSEGPVPQAESLRSAEALFDTVASSGWSEDEFGERYEICWELAFVAWRHAYALGLEAESQEWLRVAEALTLEDCTAVDCLRLSMLLGDQGLSRSRSFSSSWKLVDVFVALAVLKRERLSRTTEVSAVAASLYEMLLRHPPRDSSDSEREFVLGELALVVAMAHRYRRRCAETSTWHVRARSHFRRCSSNRPMRLRLQVDLLLVSRDMHNLRHFKRHVPKLIQGLKAFGLYREQLVCRLVLALINQTRGRNDEALIAFRAIYDEVLNTSEYSILATVAANVGQLHALAGQMDLARPKLAEALAAAEAGDDSCAVGNAWACIGGALRDDGDSEGSIAAMRKSIEIYSNGGFESWAAYVRILLADMLMSLNRTDEARIELILAAPVVLREGMFAEGVHALRLLSEVSRTFVAFGHEGLDLVNRLEKRFGIQ